MQLNSGRRQYRQYRQNRRRSPPTPGRAAAHHRRRQHADHRIPHQHPSRWTGGQLADLELRPRRHARVEDRIRAAKDTGIRNLPVHDAAQNRIWVAIAALAADLLAWCARLALPAAARTYEPKRLRLRILAVAGRFVCTARRRVLHIDPDWPWADTITTAHARLRALPVP